MSKLLTALAFATLSLGTLQAQSVYNAKSVDAEVTSSESTYQFSSLYLPMSATITEGQSVFKAKVDKDNHCVVLTKVKTETIPANTAVIVCANADIPTNTYDTDFDGNELIGTLVKLTIPDDGFTYYAMRKDTYEFAKLATGLEFPNNKAYLKVEETSEAKSMNIVFGGETTDIKGITVENADKGYYTLQGVKVVQPMKGIYVHKGKKIVVK